MEQTKNCVFCDRAQFEERLCGETKDFWIIATLGQIPKNGGYILLVPKRHVECVGAIKNTEIPRLGFSMNWLLSSVIDAVFCEYDVAHGTIFEHGIVGQTIKHAHLHLVPAVINFTDRVRKDFPVNEIISVKSWNALQKLYSKRQEPYLLWPNTNRGGEMLTCWNPAAPPQYLRTVVAEALGVPERANWRNMDPELDKKLWSETVTRLKPYFK